MWLIFCHFLCSLKSLARSPARRFHPPFRPASSRYNDSLHTDCTRNADHRKASFRFVACAGPPQGSAHVSETFLRRDDALRWSRLAELSVDRNETPVRSRIGRIRKFGELVRLHIEDMTAVGKAPRQSKAATLDMLQRELGALKISTLDRERLIQFGRARSDGGAGPVTPGIDIGTIGLVVSHAAAVHGLPISTEQVGLARIALKRLGLVGKGMERDRRPTEREVENLIALFEADERQIIPVGRIIQSAIATAMRLDEVCRVDWADVNERTRMLLVRDRKDPRNKQGNDQRIPLFGPSGYDGWTTVIGATAANVRAL
jgi:hypothetical protein